MTRCLNGDEVSICQPGQPQDGPDVCDGQDTDCDGTTDENFLPVGTVCGEGICSAQGETACVDGRITNTCEPGVPNRADNTCNGQDDDCDGRIDEGYQGRGIICGQGICQRDGVTRCVGGDEVNACVPGTPIEGPDGCRGGDSDCDGEVDEDCAVRD